MAKAVAEIPLTETETALIAMVNTWASTAGGTFAGEEGRDATTSILIGLPQPLLLRLTRQIQFDEWEAALGLAINRPDVLPRWLRVLRADTRPDLHYFEGIRARLELDRDSLSPAIMAVRREVDALPADAD
jgi:hypothetical protein